MWNIRRRILSQNFLNNRKLVEELVRNSSIGPHDFVVEIGPREGIITDYLLQKAKQVIAIELDASLYSYLQKKFKYHGNKLHLIYGDFLRYRLPICPYKVFANIPFSIEGKIIRKLLAAPNPPDDCYLVMRHDLAIRLGGFQKECQFSLFYKPWFTLKIIHYFQRTDFVPNACMDAVMIRVTKRELALVSAENKTKYMIFIGQGFGGGRRLKQNLSVYFSYNQFVRLAKALKFSIRAKPSHLSLDQWISLYALAYPSNGK